MLDRLAVAFAGQRGFIADASHELRTPLTVIRGQLEVLAAYDDPPVEEVRRVERVVQAEVTRMTRLVDDLLLLAAAERHDFVAPEPIDLRPFLTDLWDGLELTADRRFELAPSRRTGSCTPTRTASRRRCATSAATRSSTPRSPPGWSASRCRHSPVVVCCSRCSTTDRGSARRSATTCSSACTEPTRPAPGRPAARVWGWRSSERSSRHTAARVLVADTPRGGGARIEVVLPNWAPRSG